MLNVQYSKAAVYGDRAWNWFHYYLVQALMDGKGTKIINGNPFGLHFLRHRHLVRSLCIADVKKAAVVVVNVANQVSRALLCVLVVVIVNRNQCVAAILLINFVPFLDLVNIWD